MTWSVLYWLAYLGIAFTLLILSSSNWLRRAEKQYRPFWFVLLYVALVAIGRWRSIFYPTQRNPDESLMLAQAMKFDSDLMPWRSVDTGTGGPIDSYVLLFLHWLGLPFGYLLARLAAVVCIASYLVFLFLAFRRMTSTRIAALCVTPLAVFYANPSSIDFVHYSSELASMAEIGLMCWVVSGFEATATQVQIMRAAFIGAIGILVAFSKIQAIPVAAIAATVLICLRSTSLRQAIVRLSLGTLCEVLFAAFIVAILLHAGVGEDLCVSFIDLPRTYTASPLDFSATMKFVVSTDDTRDFSFVSMALICAALTALACKSNARHFLLYAVIPMALVAVGTYVAIAQPGRLYPHYLNYFAFGATLALFIVCHSADAHVDA